MADLQIVDFHRFAVGTFAAALVAGLRRYSRLDDAGFRTLVLGLLPSSGIGLVDLCAAG